MRAGKGIISMSNNRGGDPVPVHNAITDAIALISKKQERLRRLNDLCIKLGGGFIRAVRSNKYAEVEDINRDITNAVRMIEETRAARTIEELEALEDV